MSAVLAAAVILTTAAASPIPRAASPEPTEGRVVVECLVAPQGALADCLVVEETPAGHGLAERALTQAAKLKMDVPMVDGVPAAGARVRVPFNFKL
jgi:protein TonB